MNKPEHEERKRSHGCQNPKRCAVSSDPFDNLTFGWGKLDDNGYWQHECAPCARAFENNNPEYKGMCIPFEKGK